MFGLSGSANAIPLVLTQTFDQPAPVSGDSFGAAVSVSGNNALVGVFGDNTNGDNVGQAHLFDTATGALLRTFNDPTPTFSDNFGRSVSVFGNNVLIGAPRDGTVGPSVGQAHLFDAASGALVRTFNDPTVTAFDNFGASVAVSGDFALVGAVGDDTGGGGFFQNIGQAHLFDLATGNLLQTFSDNTPASNGLFASTLSISGNNVLIGAPGTDLNGLVIDQALLFDAVSGDLLFAFIDPALSPANPRKLNGFGRSVSVDGDLVLIGSSADDTTGFNTGRAYLFDATTGALLRAFDNPTPESNDLFGRTVSISGSDVLIGATLADAAGVDNGQAYLFDALTGDLLQTFNDPIPSARDGFASALSIDGDNVLFGVSGRDIGGFFGVGQAHLFSTGTQVPEPSSLVLLGIGLLGLGAVRGSSY